MSTLAETVLEVETWFKVSDESGFEQHWRNKDDKIIGGAGRDMNRAPSGDKYITMCSSGIAKPGAKFPVLFTDESFAARWWRYSMEDYAETIAPKDEWKKLFLFWRERPEFTMRRYMAIDMAELVQEGVTWSGLLQTEMGTVSSKLVITKTGPDGLEEDY